MTLDELKDDLGRKLPIRVKWGVKEICAIVSVLVVVGTAGVKVVTDYSNMKAQMAADRLANEQHFEALSEGLNEIRHDVKEIRRR